jgi:protein ImuB
MRVACIRLNDPSKRQEFAQACLRFTPQIALGETAIFLEIGACRKLYSEQTLHQRLQILLRRFQLKGTIAIANDIPTALAISTYGKQERTQLPIQALQIYVSPFRTSDSLQKATIALHRLGIQTLGHLMQLPRAAVGDRFAKEILFALHCIDSAISLPWPRYIPPEKIIQAQDINEEYRVTSLEPILFILRGLCDRALLRLRGRGELASTVAVDLVLENYSHLQNNTQRRTVIDLAMPQASAVALIPILAERLQNIFQNEPLTAPVRTICFEVLRTCPGFGKQRDFFSTREEELESFRSVVARLTERLGFDRAFMATLLESYFPDRAWKKTLQEPQEVTTPLPERPLRILRTPQKIQKLDSFFIFQKRRWQAIEMIGPERLSGEWWLNEQQRDYFRIRTKEGEDLWIFSLANNNDFYLHGIFD